MAGTICKRLFGFSFLLVCVCLPFHHANSQDSGRNGIWISKNEIDKLPVTGPPWNNLLRQAQNNTNNPDLSNQDDKTDTNTLAKALVYARTGDTAYADQVLHTLKKVVALYPISKSSEWVTLGVLRSVGSYAIAADLIDLKTFAPDFDQNQFRPWLDKVRYAELDQGDSLVRKQEVRPNNYGTHGSASRIAAALYLGDQADLDRAHLVFRGWLGDRSAYAGFKYGDRSWQADQQKPVGINPKGSTINGVNVDGALPDDARRCGKFNPGAICKTNYTWEGLQGAVAAAEMLHRAGYPAFEYSDQAILRAVEWLHNTTFSDGKNYPAEGDDVWQIYIVNKRYGTNFPTGGSSITSPGKMIGYSDWTHSSTRE